MKRFLPGLIFMSAVGCGCAASQEAKNAEIPDNPSNPNREIDLTVPVWKKGSGKDFSGAYPAIPDVKNMDDSSPVKLTLPKLVYGMTGVETRVYFHNLVDSREKEKLRFRADCPVGNSNERYWSYTPEKAGDNLLKITVEDASGKVIGTAETIVRVAPAESGNDRNAVILMIGDSILGNAQITRFLQAGIQERGNRNIRFMGSHSGQGEPLALDKVAVEAYGGWTWDTFLTLWKTGNEYNCRSKFLKMVDGKPQLAIQEYLDKYNAGKAPDIVILYLGCNDIAGGRMDTIDKRIEHAVKHRDLLIAELRKVMPNALFGVALLSPANSRPSAFELNYKGTIQKEQYDYNQFSYVRRMLSDLQNATDLSIIPLYVGTDTIEDYPENNAVHPIAPGQQKLARMFEMWLKNVMK